MAENSTKARLADCLKQLMNDKPLDKITINELTQAAKVTRNTFYYHFSDVYQLVEWVYQNEIVDGLAEYQHLKNWHMGYVMLLDYVVLNKTFCLNTSRSLGREYLENFLYQVAANMVNGVVLELNPEVDSQIQAQIVNFYGWALVAQIMQWLLHNLHEPKEELLKRTKTTLSGVIRHCLEQQS